ncbi:MULTISPECIES: ABC transporter permease [Rhodobacterales]|jgi:peptide/nickel transport system permease protein|uniref:ABC transporter permease n=1 Tax=Phaeobacter gallaeciensis TaxID=60890 RepID=A0A1B0ZPX9_9RHOB|nr:MULTISPECIES: ABC transporter permease [Phaeobacter]MDF1772176.1 ABC transporter permease [Pseudophaeobacter sp. bin_em_oilr2.035]ANP36232.1 ABC transporter permease [Phaeobacter gallaeciensis]MDE4060706.1 ABC transporter permease [Phaeobacter gallaeciensis]MDE4097356.1 ABC transporter permease [Phaeobacter gallaeciensis]MDE4106130.1 ABC transporter permease [Phaeobacter gallaeciensis]
MNASFLIRRIGYGLVLMLGVVVLNFLLIRLAPGDPAVVIAGEMGGATEEMLESIREEYGLNKPLITQLGIYVGNVVTGDLGESFFFNQPVATLIAQRILPTILLVVTAQVLSIIIGVFLGVIAARKPNGVMSAFVSVFATIGYAVPVFWTGIMLIILFASVLPIFPVEGMQSVKLRDAGIFVQALDVLHHLALPAFTLAIIYLAQYARLSRASMLEVLGSDYIRTAKAKGASQRSILFKHALRNAALPILTVAGLQFGNLISGALLVETVFNWPGMGRLAFDSILRRDYPTIMGVLFFASAMVVIANILTDMSYRLADPRLRGKS